MFTTSSKISRSSSLLLLSGLQQKLFIDYYDFQMDNLNITKLDKGIFAVWALRIEVTI